MKLLIYGHKINDKDELTYVESLIKCAQDVGAELVFYRPYLKELQKYDFDTFGLSYVDTYRELKEIKIDVAITLGGDGTILKVITLIKDTKIPILGINLGRLGFLASVEKTIIKSAIDMLVNKEYTVVTRSLLSLKCNMPLFELFPFALNDFTLNKRDTSSMITIHTYIDDVLLNSYWADGLIVATPTGSTGYSLSCNGPVVFPDSASFVITPVSPHNLNIRPIIVPDNTIVSFEVDGRTDGFLCTLDSRREIVPKEIQLAVRKENFGINLIRLNENNFLQTLRNKLSWGLDKRN